MAPITIEVLQLFLLAGLAYLLGSFPSALIIGKYVFETDIRQHGSGNPGSTNALRVFGWQGALMVFVLDVAKGLLAVLLGLFFLNYLVSPSILADSRFLDTFLLAIAGYSAILGHCFSPFMDYRGGKGIATTLGVIVVLFDLQTVMIVAVIWFVVVGLTRYVSVASLSAVYVLPFISFFMYSQNVWLLVFSILLFILVSYTHRENIGRLARGKELKISDRPKPRETFADLRNL